MELSSRSWKLVLITIGLFVVVVVVFPAAFVSIKKKNERANNIETEFDLYQAASYTNPCENASSDGKGKGGGSKGTKGGSSGSISSVRKLGCILAKRTITSCFACLTWRHKPLSCLLGFCFWILQGWKRSEERKGKRQWKWQWEWQWRWRCRRGLYLR